MRSKHQNYYLHIEILRTIAVLSVVGFHMGWSGFNLGYLGVDVFFVVSGFLMVKIFSSMKSDDYKTFYFRRLMRLIPAYLTTSVITFVAFFLIVLPFERYEIAKQNLMANLFISNFYYWTENQYFSSSGLKPILSFWSLALEVQFYLLFPLLYRLILRSKVMFFLLMLVSLAINTFLHYLSPETAFFFLPSRLWEFMVGVYIAFRMNYSLKILPKKPLLAGIIFILFPVFLLGSSFGFGIGFFIAQQNLFLNLLIVLLTALAILYGFIINEMKIPLNRLYQVIGGYSYSIYLVHLPIITLICYTPFAGNNQPGGDLQLNAMIILSILLCSFVLSRTIENPFRSKNQISKLRNMYFSSLAISLVFLLTFKSHGNFLVDEKFLKVSSSQIDRSSYRCGIIDRIEIFNRVFGNNQSCLVTSPSDGDRFLLIGNSHANSIQDELGNLLQNRGDSLFVLRDPLALNSRNLNYVKSEVIKQKIDTVVMHSSSNETNHESLIKLIDFLKKEKKSLFIIGPIPTFSESVPLILFNYLKYGTKLPFKDKDFFDNLYMDETVLFKSLSEFEHVTYFDSVSVFCKEICLFETDGYPIYFDSNHLTNTGASFLLNGIKNIF
jgi:peptidoglycan/LPS O-acetylase OafA/YrhL